MKKLLTCDHTLDAIPDLGAVIRLNVMFDDPFIVIDKQAKGSKLRQLFLYLIELDCASDRVGRAASQLPLIIHGRTARPEVGAGRQCQSNRVGHSIVAPSWVSRIRRDLPKK